MTTSTHLAPEEIMAFLDGELPASEAIALPEHLEVCGECKAIADHFRQTSALLSQWSLPQMPSTISLPHSSARSKRWKPWAFGFAGLASFVTVIFVVLLAFQQVSRHSGARMAMSSGSVDYIQAPAPNEALPEQKVSRRSTQVAALMPPPPQPNSAPSPPAATEMARFGGGGAGLVQTPLVARSVSLGIQVRSVATARASLDAIVARHHGYAAQLTAGTAENASPNLQASLRIPAPELAATIAEVRNLGRVQTETQSGEEVTQQHADLVARLTNARESETRLRTILQQRTGKVSDVLEVEEEITRIRGEIESMQAEQQTLEHRVDFATIDVQLSEQFKATLDSTDNSASTRLHNAFVAGYRNASETLLGIVLFFGEYGPALLIWIVILGVPVLLGVRRYRNLKARP